MSDFLDPSKSLVILHWKLKPRVKVMIDVSFGINEVREAWESQRKSFTSEFFEADPCTVSFFYYTPFGQYADVFPCAYEHVDVELCFLFP
ncbi:hypothetical protein Gotur_002405 [Gossypium turneri]